MTGTALVVDDAATVRMYHRDILEAAGFSVEEAANGYEALEIAIARAFDIILVDINMPQLDGYALVTSLRRKGPNRTTPILVVSTDSSTSSEAHGYACGANAFLGKPVPAALLTTLAGSLAKGAR